MTDKKDEAAETAKNVAEQFLGTLGLVDIVVGSPALYLARLHLTEGLTKEFPSTGISAANFLLMLTAAGLVGKMIVLVAYFLIAVCRVVTMR